MVCFFIHPHRGEMNAKKHTPHQSFQNGATTMTQTRSIPESERKAFSPRTAKRLKPQDLYVLTSGKSSNGYHDFIATLDDTIDIKSTFYLGHRPAESSIVERLAAHSFRRGDVLVLVRGGGQPLHPSFAPFYNFEAARFLALLRREGVIIITGLGHADNTFTVDYAARFREITPTAAAIRVNKLYARG
jgi:exonuclease VII large subunit